MKKEGNRILAPNIFPFSKLTETQMLFHLMLYKCVILPLVLFTRTSPGLYRMAAPWRRNAVFITKVPVKSVARRGEL